MFKRIVQWLGGSSPRMLLWMVASPLGLAALGGLELARLWAVDAQGAGVVRMAAALVVAAGGAAALWGGGGLWAVRRAGRQAMRSREALMDAFARWRVGLARYLGWLLAFVALASVALVLVYVGMVWQMLAGHVRVYAIGARFGPLLLAAGMAWGSVVALWRLRRVMQLADEPFEVRGLLLTPAQAPGLWRHVADLAQRVGTAAPDHLVLGLLDGFCVTCARLRVLPGGPLLQGRTLYVPLTYLCLLRRDEVDAAIAHELGHLLGEDGVWSMRFTPLYTGMQHALERLTDEEGNVLAGSAPALFFGEYVLESFHLAVQHWRRARELEADAVSARVAGPQATARALVHVCALSPVVDERLEAIARHPDEAEHDLIAMLQADAQAKPLQAPDLTEEAAAAHPYDAHPPTLERLRVLGAGDVADLLLPDADAPGWARSLFADADAVQRQLLDDFKTLAAEQKEQARRELTDMRNEAQGNVAVHEGRFGVWLTSFLTLGQLGLAVLVAFAGAPQWPLALCLLAGGICCALLAHGHLQRVRVEVMTLTPAALLVPGLAAPLPWGDVEDLSAASNGHTLTITFMLAPETPLPAHAHNNRRRLKVSATPRAVIVEMLTPPKGMTELQLLERVLACIRAWHAGKALEEM